jgi:ribonuclease HI
MFHYEILFDGGDKNVGQPDATATYGSYRLKAGEKAEVIRKDWGKAITFLAVTTNQEAEYMSLIEGLGDLLGRILVAERNPKSFNVLVQGDAEVVLLQLTPAPEKGPDQYVYACRAENLRPFRDKCLELIDRFGTVTLEKVARDQVVSVLGH